MARRSYGSGSLSVRTDAAGRDTFYGTWRSGGRAVKRKLGPKRQKGERVGQVGQSNARGTSRG
jgi:integrase